MKLEQNIPDWNKDGVWKNVANKLHQKRKRRFLYWWLIGPASMVVFIGFLIGFNNVEFNNTSLDENSISKTEQKTSPEEMQNNFPSDQSIVLKKNAKQQVEPNIPPIKPNVSIEQGLSKNASNSTSASIQPEEFVLSATNLKSKKNTPIVSTPQKISSEKTATKSTVHKKTSFLDALPILPIDWSAIDFNRKDSALIKNFNPSLSQNNKEKRIATFLWIESGLSFGKKSFRNLNSQTIARTTTEQFRFMQTNAIGIQRFLYKNWSLKLGLAYQTIYEKYEYTPSITEEEEIFSEEAIVYDLQNSLTYSEPGIATLRTTRTRQIIHNNFIHRLSVPLELAYTFQNKDWSLAPSLGFRFQLAQGFNGIIAQEGNHFFDLKAINNTYYSNDVSMGLVTSLNLKYRIFQKGSLGMRFTYERDDFLNWNNNDLVSRYEAVGLQVGYYYSF